MTSKTPIGCQRHRIEPELHVTARLRDVNVRWLAILQTVKEESLTANPEQYSHGPSLHPMEEEAASLGVTLANSCLGRPG
jgi:hypothetical protein